MAEKFKKRNGLVANLHPEDKYDYEFLSEDPSGNEFIIINPNSLILPNFDSRSADGLIDKEFKESIKKDGVLTSIIVAPVRHKITKVTGYLVIAGRRRTRAAREVGLTEVKCTVTPTTLLKAKIIAGLENMRRQDVTAWDTACYFKDLRDCHGLSQTEIKSYLSTSDATVSQYLGIFELAEPVQQLIASGQLGLNAGTKVRFLKQIDDPNDQLAIAQLCIENNWNTVALDNYVKKYLAQNNKKTAGTGKSGRKKKADTNTDGEATSSSDETKNDDYFKVEDFKLINMSTLNEIMNQTAIQIDQLRASNKPNEEKIQYHIGKLDAFKQCVGLKSIPASLVVKEETQAEDPQDQ